MRWTTSVVEVLVTLITCLHSVMRYLFEWSAQQDLMFDCLGFVGGADTSCLFVAWLYLGDSYIYTYSVGEIIGFVFSLSILAIPYKFLLKVSFALFIVGAKLVVNTISNIIICELE